MKASYYKPLLTIAVQFKRIISTIIMCCVKKGHLSIIISNKMCLLTSSMQDFACDRFYRFLDIFL